MSLLKDISMDITKLSIASAGKISAPKIPQELSDELEKNPKARELWKKITPIARRDWILWITSAKKSETSVRRINVACSKLSNGKGRVCCFGGINWLIKMNAQKKLKK